jgi:1,4-dihydroxy-2-naphthoate octaprenyltransferase
VERLTAGTAFTAIPKITLDQWQGSSLITRWMIASRAAVLVMTFSSAALAGVLALLDGTFQLWPWLACTLGLLLAHAANNQLNDYTDSKRGIDSGNYFRNQYGAHVLEDGLLSERALWGYISVTGGVALLLGLYLLWRVGPPVIFPLLAGAFFLLFYTYPLKKLGLGEPAVLLVWGPLMTGGTYLVMTGGWDWQVALIGTVYALAPTSVIFGKHVDKIEFDAAKGVKTLPVRLGARRSLNWIVAMTWLQYLSLPVLVFAGWLPWTVIVVCLALPAARRLVRACAESRPDACPPDYPESAWPLWYVAFAFSHARSFGLLFLLGLLVAWPLALMKD